MTKQFVIVGAGIAGLTAASLINSEHRDARILVIEQSTNFGGLHRCFDYGQFGIFDCGMHFITTTGVEEIDDLLFGLLPRDKWETLKGSKRDLSGLFFRGELQQNSQFVDLRKIENQLYRECVADFFFNLQANHDTTDSGSMADFARQRFGPFIAKTYIEPIVRKVHGRDATEIDVMAKALPLLDRIVLFNEETFTDLMESPILRSRLAYPEQRNLPLKNSSGRHSIYPSEYGIGKFVESFVKMLKDKGVEFLTNTRTESLSVSRERITELRLSDGSVLNDPTNVIWTAGLPPLAKALSLSTSGLAFDAPQSTVICSVLIDQPPLTGDLYCLFFADEPYRTYRLTNFTAYCPNAPRAGGYPICLELLMLRDTPNLQESARALAVKELRQSQLITDDTNILFSAAEVLPGGFPSLTRNNISSMNSLRSKVNELGIKNLINCGILAEPGVFFQHDVLLDAYRKISGTRLAHGALSTQAHA